MYSEALMRSVPVAPDHGRSVSAARDAGWEQWGGRGFERTTPPCGCGCLFTLNKGGENNKNRVGQTATIWTLGVHKVLAHDATRERSEHRSSQPHDRLQLYMTAVHAALHFPFFFFLTGSFVPL